MKIFFLLFIILSSSVFAQRREMFASSSYKFGKNASLLTSSQISTLSGISTATNLQTQINNAPQGRTSYDAAYISGRLFPIIPFSMLSGSGSFSTLNASGLSAPTTTVQSSAFSPDGRFLALGDNSTPFMRIYESVGGRAGSGTTAWSRLPDPATIAPGTVTGIAWSPDGRFLAISSSATPFMRVYERGKDNVTFTAVTTPTLAGSAQSIAWSPCGRFLLVGLGGSNTARIIERNASTTFIDTGVLTLPVGSTIVWDIAFSPSGRFVTLGTLNGLSLNHYSITRGASVTFTRITDPVLMPFGQVFQICYDPQERYLFAVGSITTMMPYSINSGTGALTRLNDPTGGSIEDARGCAISPDGKNLLVTFSVSGSGRNYHFFTVNQSTFAMASMLPSGTQYAAISTNNGNKAAWSPYGRYIFMGKSGSFDLFESSGVRPTTKGRTPIIRAANLDANPLWY